MRSISLVQKIEHEYKGSVFQNAIGLVDIDNDGNNELCICNTNGDLHVYKGVHSTKPWKVNKGLGSIVVLCGGPVRDKDENVLCVLDTEGCCHMLDVFDENNVKESENELSKSQGPASSHSHAGELRLIYHEKLIQNPKVAILEDIDNDGTAELIIGYTDRFVRIYKWQIKDMHETAVFSTKSTVVKQPSKDEVGERKPALSFTLSLSKETKNDTTTESKPTTNDKKTDKCVTSHAAGGFVLIKQFSLYAQLGSLAVCKTVEGLNELIVSQPNGGYCILGTYDNDKHCFTEDIDPNTPTSDNSPTLSSHESYPSFYPISHARVSRSTQGSHTNTEIIGGIKRQNRLTGIIGLCTQDGKYMILDNSNCSHTHTLKNSSEHRWFSMSKLDITNNGDDEIVLCSMNGMTYIIDKERDIVSFDFADNVAAFCAGMFNTENKQSSPVLCYVTFSGKIVIYYNVWIDAMKVKCVHGALLEKIQQRDDLTYILDMLKLPNGEIDHQRMQALVKNIWSEKT